MAYFWTATRRARWHASQGFYDRDPRTETQRFIDDIEQACTRLAGPVARAAVEKAHPDDHRTVCAYYTEFGLRTPPPALFALARMLSDYRAAAEDEAYNRALEAAKRAARRVMTKQAQP